MVLLNSPAKMLRDHGYSPKSNRPRVDAVPQFPSWCRYSNKSNCPRVDAVRKFPSGCGYPTKSKRPRVDAVRQFPSGCGSISLPIDPTEYEEYDATVMPAQTAAQFVKIDSPRWPVIAAEDMVRNELHDDVVSRECRVSYKDSKAIVAAEDMARNELHDDVVSQECRVSSKDSKAVFAREKVKETLDLFRKLYIELKGKENIGSHKNLYMRAAMKLKNQQKWVNTSKQYGPVPGVEVGDEFQCATELRVIGLHHQFFSGIDYMKEEDGRRLATSIIASGRYAANKIKSLDEVIYSGQGGNPRVGRSEPKDQKLVGGNIALKNSCEAKTPVRFIIGFKKFTSGKKISKPLYYIYAGLYLVDSWKEERGQNGKLVFKFVLKRKSDQPKVTWGELKKLKSSIVQKDVICVNDISKGKEKIPIRVVNAFDDETHPSFHYMENTTYPKFCKGSMPSGCDCIDGCLDPKRCSCAIKNGGEMLYDRNGRIIKGKSLLYECSPSCRCRCSSSCINRVSQLGIRFKLEIFKKNLKGWGVRTRAYIPSGSFVCEYIAEGLCDNKGKYLFDVGKKDENDHFQVGYAAPISPSQTCLINGGFPIDAPQYGNVGRFINHSCSPNLVVQNVLYDHKNRELPHIMLFAMKDIPASRELTFDYNCITGQVRDVNRNIKMKSFDSVSPKCIEMVY